jgi:ABC-type multidrug transport system ATPase subunit
VVDATAIDGAADGTAGAAGDAGTGAGVAKPVRSTTRAPRPQAAPRSPGTRAPAAKKKPTVDATAESGDDAGSGDQNPQRPEPATAAARVTVSRTPAARKTPAKQAAAKATRLPATTTPTADTAEAVEAAMSPVTDSGDANAAASAAVGTPDETATEVPRPGPDAARQAAAKAASAKAAAAKTESAAKARAARAAATKAAAAKAAAARSAAAAAARAATLAARAADSEVSDADAVGPDSGAEAPAKAVTPGTQPKPTEPSATAQGTTAESATERSTTEQVESESADDTNANAIAQPAEERGATAPEADVDSEAPAGVAEPARAERRPFWRMGKPSPKPSPAVPAAPLPVSESADAEPAAEPTPLATPVASVVRKPLPPRPTMSGTATATTAPIEITVSGLNKRFGQNVAVADVNLEVRAGSFYGIVGPNGAGKTTTLSMITGLLRPDSGSISVHGIDVWADPVAAKRAIGVLPDRLRLFDRLTGAQLLYYSGVLRGLEAETVRARSADLAAAFGLESALNRLVADYSAGMTKKIALACAMIHSPRVLVLDEPFESVDPVSAVNVTEILQRYVGSGGTVILSSHGMDLIQRVCDNVAIIVQGSVLASGTIDEVRGNASLEERFVELAGGRKVAEGLEWLHNFSD